MVYNRYTWNIILRVILIAATSVLFSIAVQSKVMMTSLLLFGVFLFQTIWLIKKVNQTNQSVVRFLDSIRHKDLSVSFNTTSTDLIIKEINQNFNDLVNYLRQAKIEKESQHYYFQAIIEHVGIGLIAFREDGEVEIYNQAAKDLLGLVYISNINTFAKVDSQLPDIFRKLQPEEQRLHRILVKGDYLMLSTKATMISLEDKKVKLVSLQDIRTELDAKEIEAWQKLIRVLTHEIMNSVSPITSLGSTLLMILQNEKKEGKLSESLQDVSDGIETITRRSKGLMNFVESYRSLASMPKPKFEEILVKDVFDSIRMLMENKIKTHQISCIKSILPENLKLFADRKLIEQVLINLLNNALEAFTESNNRQIELSARENKNDRIVIVCKDNGQGMDAETLDRIFVPFFTTKEKGSGIGLSLSKQIMSMHGGSITVTSAPNEGTMVVLEF